MLSIIDVKFLAELSAETTSSTVMFEAERSEMKANGSKLRSAGSSVPAGIVLKSAKNF